MLCTASVWIVYNNIVPPRVFCAPAEGVPLGIGYRRLESKMRIMGLRGREKKSDDIFSLVDTILGRDRPADR